MARIDVPPQGTALRHQRTLPYPAPPAMRLQRKTPPSPMGQRAIYRGTTSVHRPLTRTASESPDRLLRDIGRSRPPLLSFPPFKGPLRGVLAGPPVPLSPAGSSLVRWDPVTLPHPCVACIIAQEKSNVNSFFSWTSSPSPRIPPRQISSWLRSAPPEQKPRQVTSWRGFGSGEEPITAHRQPFSTPPLPRASPPPPAAQSR